MIDTKIQNENVEQLIANSSPGMTPINHDIKPANGPGNLILTESNKKQNNKELINRIAQLKDQVTSVKNKLLEESVKIVDSMKTETQKSIFFGKNDIMEAIKKSQETAIFNTLNNVGNIVAPAIENQQATVDILVTVLKNHEETIDTLKAENADLRNEINNLKNEFKNEVNRLQSELKTELKNEVSFLHSQAHKIAKSVKNLTVEIANRLKQIK